MEIFHLPKSGLHQVTMSSASCRRRLLLIFNFFLRANSIYCGSILFMSVADPYEGDSVGLTFREFVLDDLTSLCLQCEFFPQPILQQDYVQLSYLEHSAVDACIRVSPAPDGPPFDEPAITFHHECPCCPYRASCCNPICNMKEAVHGDWAGRDSQQVLLIKDPFAV